MSYHDKFEPVVTCDTCGEKAELTTNGFTTIIAPFPTNEPMMVTQMKHACSNSCAIPLVFAMYEKVLIGE